ncbi:hypothetical protein RYH80_11740 [Halobaculum sp. MBLA0147]|uniref:hypothetical protein n=1 Tax=Halobaculum sp. MBLA0147 TaxID=3079934 RepID=UPI00352608E4
MVTVTDFLVELAASVAEMAITIGTEVALRDPLSFVSVVAGTAFLVVSTGVLGYVALGALLQPLGLSLPSPGRGTREAEGRIPTGYPNPEAGSETAGAGAAKQDER